MIRKAVWYGLALMSVVALALPAFASTDIIPCAVGNKWEYSCYKLLRAKVDFKGRPMATLKDASSGSSIYEVTSKDDSANPPVFEYVENTRMQSVNGNSGSDRIELKIQCVDGLQRILMTRQESDSDNAPDIQTYDPPLIYYMRDAESGKSWTVGSMRDGDTAALMTAKGTGRETVTVPAGTFENCLKVVYTSDELTGTMEMWDKTFTITSGKSRGIYWIADGVGVVKELEVAISTAETEGPDGIPVTVEAATCTVSELKPGYTISGSKDEKAESK